MWPSASSSVTVRLPYAMMPSNSPSLLFPPHHQVPEPSFSSLHIPLISQTASTSLVRGSPSQQCRPRSTHCRHLVCAEPLSSRGRQLNDLLPAKHVLLSFYMLVLGFTCKLSLR